MDQDFIITFENDGQNILRTNYFDSPASKMGYVFLTINAGAFRLLVPDEMAKSLIAEVATAKEVIVSRGIWEVKGGIDALEIMFEDDSDNPFCFHISTKQVHTLPAVTDCNKQWLFAVYNSKGKVAEYPCWYRIVEKLPCCEPYKRAHIN